MGKETNIQWCDATWSPWLGCRKVSEECDNCYITETTPFRVRGIEHGSQRVELSEAYWRQPVRWNAQVEKEELERCKAGESAVDDEPIHHPRVFPSLCDWLDKEVPIRLLARFLKLIHDTPNLDWLLLTKRIQNFMERMDEAMRYMVHEAWDSRVIDWVINWKEGAAIPGNIWLGVSAGTQDAADARIPQLFNTPARVRFISVEPMLESVNLAPHFLTQGLQRAWPSKIHWVIVGGESGPKARPCNMEGIRDIVRQCAAANVPCYVKQLGSLPVFDVANEFSRIIRDKKGGHIAEWPEDIRVRQFPELAPR